MYVCKLGDNTSIAYNTHNDRDLYTGVRPGKPCLSAEFPLVMEQVLAEVNKPQ